jgi:hypothetical protein
MSMGTLFEKKKWKEKEGISANESDDLFPGIKLFAVFF